LRPREAGFFKPSPYITSSPESNWIEQGSKAARIFY
jgi:hypothetical protein